MYEWITLDFCIYETLNSLQSAPLRMLEYTRVHTKTEMASKEPLLTMGLSNEHEHTRTYAPRGQWNTTRMASRQGRAVCLSSTTIKGPGWLRSTCIHHWWRRRPWLAPQPWAAVRSIMTTRSICTGDGTDRGAVVNYTGPDIILHPIGYSRMFSLSRSPTWAWTICSAAGFSQEKLPFFVITQFG